MRRSTFQTPNEPDKYPISPVFYPHFDLVLGPVWTDPRGVQADFPRTVTLVLAPANLRTV